MPRFLFAFHGGHRFSNPDEGKAYMQKWQNWSTGLGKTVVDRGMPVGQSKIVTETGVVEDRGPNPISGIMVVQAADFAQALKVAASCPHLEIGGTIEVAEGMDMSM